MKIWARRILKVLLGLIVLLVLLGLGLYLALNEERPDGESGEAAEALARRMMSSVNEEGWAATRAVTWTYGGRFNHLWDVERHFVRVRRDGFEALVNLNTIEGVATQDGQALSGAALEEAVQRGYAAWANDSFWLNAMNKAFDPGTSRSLVSTPEGDALMISYASGGVTPGDSYLWHFDENGRPKSWQMWVSIIPIGGLSASWSGWEQLATGAWVSTQHEIGPLTIEVTDLAGAASLAELEPGDDPFAALVAGATPR